MDWLLVLEWVIKGFVLIMVLLTGFAYLTLMERRFLAFMQVRVGPNRAGPFGLLQPIADAVKLIFKEELIPSQAEKLLFIVAPIVTVVPAVVITATIPWGPNIPASVFGHEITLYIGDINVGILYIAAIASIAVYGIVLAGWSSNNKYAMMGGIRSTAQMVSYELALGLAFVTVILLAGSMRVLDVVAAQKNLWFAAIQPVGAFIFLIATLAELNRAPFDMPEAEQELTAGYHTEYSGMKFALFFMAEYTKMIAIAAVAATLFFGGYREFWFLKDTWLSVDQNWWLGPLYLIAKIIVMLFIMIWVRATLPRIRYDRLMVFGWKVMLPLSLALVLISAIGVVLQASYGLLYQWAFTFFLSLLVGFMFTGAIDRSLRRKMMLKELSRGLFTTFKSMFEKTVTIQYPEEKKPVSARFRGRHVLNRYENGLEKCIGCSLCAAACPSDAIFVESAENTDEKRFSPGDRYASTYEINMLRCIYCGFCEDACPTEAITMGDNYELSFLNRREAIYNKDMLLVPVPQGSALTPQVTKPGTFTRSVPEMKDSTD